MASSATAATVASSAIIMSNPSIYTNYVNVHLSIYKLDGTNYDTWASDIKLWLKSQDYVDHLTHPNVAENEVFLWFKIDSQLCVVIKSTIHSSLKQIFRTYETCSEVWEQAKLLYTNDTQRLDGTMAEYIGKHHALLHDFNELLPLSPTPSQELKQRS